MDELRISAPDVKRGAMPWGALRLCGGIACMLAVSVAAHHLFNPSALATANFRTTAFAAMFAHVIGYAAYRRFDIFPGMAATGAILPTFLLSYATIFMAVLLFRLDYSRSQFIISLAASIVWHLSIDIVIQRVRPYRLAVIPGGQADSVLRIPGVSWSILRSPSLPLPKAQGVVVDLRAVLPSQWERFIAQCALRGVPVYHVKQVVESLTGRVSIEHLSENTLGSLNPNQLFVAGKQAVDWIAAALALLFLVPVLFTVAVAIRVDTPGPVLFRQDRVGYRGRVFSVFKFRTMRAVPEVKNGDERANAMTRVGDTRVTRVGAFLRRTRIDELPQILNILRGEMSWIGPRPEALPLSKWYETELPFYHYRHIVRPGITGWAQVNQGHVTELDDVLEKLHYDFYYIKNFSPWLDFVILLRTFVIILSGFGAR